MWPKDMKWANAVGTSNLLNTGFPQTPNLQKKTVSAKSIKMKLNKMKYSCVPIVQMMTVESRRQA